MGTASAIAAAATHAPDTAPRTRPTGRFDPEAFTEDCKRANTTSGSSRQAAVKEVLQRAMSDTCAVLAGVGEPQKGGIVPLYRSADLTILNVTWSPLMQLMPHEHRMWSVIGIYTGREDNIFWEKRDSHVAARRASSLTEGDVLELPQDVIHSVSNPIERLTGALHIYGGDFFATPRQEWDPATLAPRSWDIQKALQIFKESNDRFFDWQARQSRG
jgi:predicted metal-dependent enzyme (double-stranded beta helix superfamily)